MVRPELIVAIALAVVACKSPPKRIPSNHRGNEIGACDPNPSAGTAKGEPDVPGGCRADTECTEGRNGRCNRRGDPHSGYQNVCSYDQCLSDAECPDKAVCTCGNNSGSYCRASTCRRDADCSDGVCSPSFGCRGFLEGYHCHTSDDTCVDNQDCASPTQCVYRAEVGHWACSNLQCPVG